MSVAISEAQLVQVVIDWVRDKQRSGSVPDGDITADTDLVASGLLDSLALIDLIASLEEQIGCKIDLTDVEPGEFCIVKGLCRITLQSQSN
jgi:acyl carrier protein